MSKITYTNKEYIYENSSIPAKNKISDDDMNEIKKVVNGIDEKTNYNSLAQDVAGKVYCNLTGTLASGDIIPVIFPTLSTATTMQLSVDNKTTYYYIKSMSADSVYNDFADTELTGSKAILYFDGTQFILDKSKYNGKIITNLNTITKSGFYTAYSTATGVPNTSYSWFIQHNNSNAGTSSAYQRAVAYSTTLIVYERTMTGGIWSRWILTSNVYSSNETPIGYWVDGKPIYRKVIDIGAVTNSDKNVSGGLTNQANIINIEGGGFMGEGQWLPWNFQNSGGFSSLHYNKTTDIFIVTVSTTSYNLISSYAVILYTKTTD